MTRRILIVKTGSAEPEVRRRHGDFEDWIARGLGVPTSAVVVADVTTGDALPPAADVAGAVVTGSASMVSQPDPWTEPTGAWLADAARGGLPVLGICYGHQLLAAALGGRVGPNPRGREIGTVTVDLVAVERAGDALFDTLPGPLVVHATHVESVLTLPEGAARLGGSALDPNHAIAFGRTAWGVQFHPEFDAVVMRGYLEERAGLLRDEGLDADSLLAGVADSGHGSALLRRFREIALDGAR